MSKFCTSCGANLNDDIKFCTECGATLEMEATQPVASAAPLPKQEAVPVMQAAPSPQAEPVEKRTKKKNRPLYEDCDAPAHGSRYEPISTKGYIGISLLACIPIIGLVLLIVWACGGCKKINKRNFARAMLIMMAIALVFSLILGVVVKSAVGRSIAAIEEETGINTSLFMGKADKNGKNSSDESSLGNVGGLLGGLAGLSGADGESKSGNTAQDDAANTLEDLGALAGLLGGLSDITGSSGGEAANSDIAELEELSKLLGGLEDLQGEEEAEGGLSELAGNAADINREAEAANDGWPATLRKYPGGSATATASYRTEISNTTLEEMMAWIEALKADGFEYQDFYDFGMSEADMLGMNGWWAYDGNTYLSVSYADGTVIVDHTKELPDLSGLFG